MVLAILSVFNFFPVVKEIASTPFTDFPKKRLLVFAEKKKAKKGYSIKNPDLRK